MTIFQAFNRGFQLTMRNLRVVSVIFIVNVFAVVVMYFLSLVFRARAGYTDYITTIDRLIEFFVYPFLMGGMLGILRDAVKEVQTNIGKFLSYGKKYYVRLFLISIVLGVVLFLMMVAFLGMTVGMGMRMPRASTRVILLVILVGLLFIFSSIFASFLPVIIVAEDAKIMGALKYTFRFFKTNSGRVIVLALTAVLIKIFIFPAAPLFGSWSVFFPAVAGALGSGIHAYLTVLVNSSLMVFYLGGGEEVWLAKKIYPEAINNFKRYA